MLHSFRTSNYTVTWIVLKCRNFVNFRRMLVDLLSNNFQEAKLWKPLWKPTIKSSKRLGDTSKGLFLYLVHGYCCVVTMNWKAGAQLEYVYLCFIPIGCRCCWRHSWIIRCSGPSRQSMFTNGGCYYQQWNQQKTGSCTK